MRLIVGLGNPGRQYDGTRHNIGFEVLEALARRCGLIASPGDFDRAARSRFDALALEGFAAVGGGAAEKVLLLKPLTFMNLSGRAVQAAMAFYHLTPADAMIVLDDIALPIGKLRLRPSGSSGGHNGLKDIESALGTAGYPRLRIGIDAPPARVPQRDYVLGRFSDPQRAALGPAIDRACSALIKWLSAGMEAAMNEFNADPTPPKDSRKRPETRQTHGKATAKPGDTGKTSAGSTEADA